MTPSVSINPHTFSRVIEPREKNLKTPLIPTVHPHTKFWCGDKRPQGIRENVGIKNYYLEINEALYFCLEKTMISFFKE